MATDATAKIVMSARPVVSSADRSAASLFHNASPRNGPATHPAISAMRKGGLWRPVYSVSAADPMAPTTNAIELTMVPLILRLSQRSARTSAADPEILNFLLAVAQQE